MLFCDNQEVILTLVEAGYAFAIMMDLPNTRLPDLAYIPVKEFPLLSFGVAYLPKQDQPVLRNFLDLLMESIEKT